MNKRHFIALLAALVMPTAFAGMYDQPYAIVESGAQSDVRKEAALAITQVDGKNVRRGRSDPIAPGKHTITVHFETARGNFRPETMDLEIDLQACTRYRIVANYEVKIGPDWKPKIYTEPIGECVKKFKK